jgi:hypothetical protein
MSVPKSKATLIAGLLVVIGIAAVVILVSQSSDIPKSPSKEATVSASKTTEVTLTQLSSSNAYVNKEIKIQGTIVKTAGVTSSYSLIDLSNSKTPGVMLDGKKYNVDLEKYISKDSLQSVKPVVIDGVLSSTAADKSKPSSVSLQVKSVEK